MLRARSSPGHRNKWFCGSHYLLVPFALSWLIVIAPFMAHSYGATQPASFTTQADPAWDKLFQSTNGWIGADGAYSIPLSTNSTLWLFGDTFVGEIKDGRRMHARMINSSLAIQHGSNAPEFYYRTNAAGMPASIFTPPDGEGYLWTMHGLRNSNGLYLILHRIRNVDTKSIFGFRVFGAELACIPNPDDPPAQWRVEQREMPFCEYTARASRNFGCAILHENGWAYIYGNASDKGVPGPSPRRRPSISRNGLVVARVPENQLDDFKAWRFYAGHTSPSDTGAAAWSTNFRDSAAICPEAPSECSVSWIPVIRKYVLVYMQGIWGRVVLRTSGSPLGPWSDARTVYQAPDMNWSGSVICYAGKGHPELSSPGDLLVTYAANSMKFADLFDDPRLYWPRFIRVNFTHQ